MCAVVGQFSRPYSTLLYGCISQELGTTKSQILLAEVYIESSLDIPI